MSFQILVENSRVAIEKGQLTWYPLGEYVHV